MGEGTRRHRTIRRHRLLELFLTEHLGYDWTEVHEEVDRLEHHISERLETELAAVLDDRRWPSRWDESDRSPRRTNSEFDF